MIVLQIVIFALLLAPAVMAAREWRRRHEGHRKD